MANQDDTLIDMPLLEGVLDGCDDSDEDDLSDKGLSKMKVAGTPITVESGKDGDSNKPLVDVENSQLDVSSEREETSEEEESSLLKLESENQTGDTASSESNNNNNNHDTESSNRLKEEAHRLTTLSTTPTTNNNDNAIADGTPAHTGDASIEIATNSNSDNSVYESSSSSSSNTQPLTNFHHQQCEDSTEGLEASEIESERNTSNNISQPDEEASASTSNTRASSPSNRLLSSDSYCSQDSIVTVEVIALPRSVVNHYNAQQDSAFSGTDEDNSSNNAERSEEVLHPQEQQPEGEDNTTSSSALGEEEEVSTVETEVVEMGDQQRLEEKLRQFENDAKEREEEANRNTDGTVQMSESEKQRRRNLIFDEERFEETFLKCLICREVYNETDKLPKMLHCHHTFCMDCLYQMYRVEGEFRQSLTSVFRNMPLTVKIQCPTCREGIIISEAEIRRLPNDHTIMELLCFVNKTGKNDVQYCPKHQMQPLNFFCEPCIMPVCCDCTVIDHKESKGHRVVNVDEAMKKYTPIVEDTFNDIRKEKATLASKKEALENTQEDLNRIQAGISDQIRKVFDSIREVLDERERELHDVAVSEVDRKQGTIEGHLNTIAERESDLNAEFNSLQIATDDKDISLMFTGHKSARDLLARKVFIPTNSTAGFSITFQFSSRADTLIKQQVANLGDVIFHS